MTTEKLINEAEAAKYLGLKQVTLKKWRWIGQGPNYQKVGSRTIRYRLGDLDHFLKTSAATTEVMGMNMTTYLTVSKATLANGVFHGERVSPAFLNHILVHRKRLNGYVDAIKKAFFYGKPSELLVDAGMTGEDADHGEEINLLHAVLGVDTESAELLELYVDRRKYTLDEFRLKVLDEGGDLLWYLALLFREAGVTFEEAAVGNIKKLKARYPDGFTTFDAIHRNESAETAALL